MRPRDYVAKLGKPDLALGPLSIWVHGREFADADPESHDFGWLRATALCTSQYSEVVANGTIIRIDEIERWLAEVRAVTDFGATTCELVCLEPNLGVTCTAKPTGQVEVDVRITPDHLHESHVFSELPLDLTYLRELLKEGEALMRRWQSHGRAD